MSLVLEQVTRRVENQLYIDNASLVLEPGSFNVLLGRTLSGKTSLMRLMAGLDKPDQGRVLMNGVDVTGKPVRQRNVSMVYQQFINYPAMTVYENIASPLRVAGKSGKEIDAAVQKAAALMKLGPYLQRTPLTLSGGQQQRTALARALVKNAELVLLDEPLANLDYKLREELREELPRLFAASGSIFVYATTEPSEALLLGGNTASLSEGRISQFGPTIDVYRNPADLVTARTFADPPLNTIDLVRSGNTLQRNGETILQLPDHLARVPEGPCVIAFQPHHLSVARRHDTSSALKARVIISEIAGSESFIHVEAVGSRWVMLEHGIHDIDPDTMVDLFVDTRHLMAFDTAGQSIAHAVNG